MPPATGIGPRESTWHRDRNLVPDDQGPPTVLGVLRDDYDEPAREGKEYSPCRTPYYWLAFRTKGQLVWVDKGRLCLAPEVRERVWHCDEATQELASDLSELTSGSSGDDRRENAGVRLAFMRHSERRCDDEQNDLCPEVSEQSEGIQSSECDVPYRPKWERVQFDFDSKGYLHVVYVCGAIAWHRDWGAAGAASSGSSGQSTWEGVASSESLIPTQAGVKVRLTALVDRSVTESSAQTPVDPNETCRDDLLDPCGENCCPGYNGYADYHCGEVVELADVWLEISAGGSSESAASGSSVSGEPDETRGYQADSKGALVSIDKTFYGDYPCGEPTLCCPLGLPDNLRLRFAAIHTQGGMLWDICLHRDLCSLTPVWKNTVALYYDEDCDGECEAHFHKFELHCEIENGECDMIFYWNGGRNKDKIIDQCCDTYFFFRPVTSGGDGIVIFPGCLVPQLYQAEIFGPDCIDCQEDTFPCPTISSTSAVSPGDGP